MPRRAKDICQRPGAMARERLSVVPSLEAKTTRKPPRRPRGPGARLSPRRGRPQAICVTLMNLLDRRGHIRDQSHAIAGVRAGQQPDLLVPPGCARVALCGLRRSRRGIPGFEYAPRRRPRPRSAPKRGTRIGASRAENRQLKSPHHPLHRPGASAARCSG